ncbi:MAG: FAD-dependent monooxygenase [Rubrivivax sp.]|nr:FAD-dependent monooxygenase [Pyrinomonadaceae bacterium]
MTRILIVGGGIGGLCAALALRREGFEPEVFEQAPALLEIGAAIAVWPNAMKVLLRLGVGETVRAKGGLLEDARWLERGGRLYKQFTLPAGVATGVALHRADLQGALLRALPPESVHLGRAFESFEFAGDEVRVRFTGGETIACDVLVGADGLHSRARAQLLGDGEPVYRGYTVWRGIARLEHPALAPRTASEIYGRGMRFGIGPVGKGRTGWWATANEPESAAELASEHQKKLLRLFDGWQSPVTELIEATPSETILRNSTYDRPRAALWGERRITLLGDAAHPMTPNFGQGGCMAIEDAAVLARTLAKYDDATAALRAYESHRHARASRVVGYSLRYGAIGQWQRASAVRLRGTLLSTFPEPLLRKLLGLIFDYDAYEVEI